MAIERKASRVERAIAHLRSKRETIAACILGSLALGALPFATNSGWHYLFALQARYPVLLVWMPLGALIVAICFALLGFWVAILLVLLGFSTGKPLIKIKIPHEVNRYVAALVQCAALGWLVAAIGAVGYADKHLGTAFPTLNHRLSEQMSPRQNFILSCDHRRMDAPGFLRLLDTTSEKGESARWRGEVTLWESCLDTER
jgi:hypothetical protein